MNCCQGTLDMLILKTLMRGPLHGYSIAEFIQETSEDALRVEEGALYPALHRLELRGLLASEWGVSENNRRAKYYRLTAAGQQTAGRGNRTVGTHDRGHRHGFWKLPKTVIRLFGSSVRVLEPFS